METAQTTQLTQEGVLKILSSREQFTAPGKRRVRVTGVTPYTGEDGVLVYLTNYAAMAPDGVEKAMEHLELGEFQQAGNTNLVSRQRLSDHLASKGEIVEILVDWVDSRNKPGTQVLRVVSMNPIAVETSKKTDFTAMFAVKKPAGATLELTNAGK